MKKTIAILIALFFICPTAFADEAVIITVGNAQASTLSEIEIPISISENSMLCGGSFNLVYDNTKLKLIDYVTSDNLSGYSCMANIEFKENAARFSWAGIEPLKNGGELFKVKFSVLNNATGVVPIYIENLKIADININKIEAISQNGKITITQSKSTGYSGGGTSATVSSNKDAVNIAANAEETNDIFKDVKLTDWFYDSVMFVYENNITKGISSTEYAPNDNVTRGQFITMLCRAYSIDEMNGNNFDDCGNTWYTGYLAAAKQLGISNGIGDNKFVPENLITREEMVTLIYNFLSINSDIGQNSELTFQDSNQVSDWAKIPVSYAASNKIVNGKENNMFDPKGYATRAELAQIFYNLFI